MVRAVGIAESDEWIRDWRPTITFFMTREHLLAPVEWKIVKGKDPREVNYIQVNPKKPCTKSAQYVTAQDQSQTREQEKTEPVKSVTVMGKSKAQE